MFHYNDWNVILLGIVLERATGMPVAQYTETRLWQPMGAERSAYVTVDRKGAARTAGGICVLPRDLLRFGELVRTGGPSASR